MTAPSEFTVAASPGFSMPSGDVLIAVVKADCPTCVLVQPVLNSLAEQGLLVSVYSQDNPAFPALRSLKTTDDRELTASFALDIDTVPTLVRVSGGREVGREVGWSLAAWNALSGRDLTEIANEGALPAHKPGCGSLVHEPGVHDRLVAQHQPQLLASRRVVLSSSRAGDDDIEAMFERGWSDGLPVVPPTAERVVRMLSGTTRAPSEIVAVVPPDLIPCTVEKVAVNAVMAGCLPEYLPVVLSAVEAACSDEFNGHGLLATTYFAGPVLIVNGPIATRIGMNAGTNVFGQGNRANATIGRALQLVIRNVGGGRPGGVDRATLGNPGKIGFCFAEDEAHSPWTSLATERGVPIGRSAVTLFAGEGPRGIVDQISRTAESLARSLAAGLRSVGHPKLVLGFDAICAVSPEHVRTFREAGWDKARLRAELMELLQIPFAELVRGAGGIEEGVPPLHGVERLPKFRPDGLWFVQCGGGAGMFSSIIGGWVNGPAGSQMVTREIES